LDDALETREPTARERAYEHVRAAILRGDYAPGAFVEEETVCKAAGVSRTPVREAFHKLEAERFLDLLPRRGARVRQVTAQELLDLYEARRVIEGFAIDRVCAGEHPAPEELARISAAMRAVAPGALLRHAELDRQFHRTLVGAARNAVMIELYDGLRARQQHVALAALGADPSRVRIILDEHDRLVEALSARDARRARRVLDAHLRPIGHVIAKLA
jgi:DNA-binding GntR family transcriptional regulator